MNPKKKNSGTANPSPRAEKSFLDKMDTFFQANMKVWFWGSFVLLFLLSLFFFDPKVSIGGDDSEYIKRGYDLVHKGDFPGFQGPLYPMVLGLIIGLAGLNLVVMKLFSVVFMLVHFRLFYLVFKRYLPASVLVPVMLMLAVNASMLYFASSNFTESFFLMVQSFFLYVFEKYFIREFKGSYTIREDYKKFLLLGLTLFLMAITKNIGLTALIAVCLFFLVRKKWLATAYAIAAFAVFQLPFTAVKHYGFEAQAAQVSGQGNMLMLKVHNNPDGGKEDFSGYVNRVVENSKEYLYRHFTIIFGLTPESSTKTSGFWTIVMYIVLIGGAFLLFNKSEIWTFSSLYLLASCGITFIVLQTYWKQERMILVYMPLLLTFALFTLYYFVKNNAKGFTWVFVVILAVLFIANGWRTIKKIPDASKALSHYLKGDLLYGFTPDWIHFFEMSRWASENLPEGSYVASRKPGMSFIYGGADFYGIWNVPSEDPDELYNRLKDAGVTHVIMASLRTDPSQNTGRTITTVRRYLSIIHSKYPDKIEFVHKIGEEEPAFLYKLN